MLAIDPGQPALAQQLEALQDAPHWYVGLSGGIDSTVLLHLLVRWREARCGYVPPLTALHVNHGLQEEADRWQALCAAICNKLQVPLVVLPVAVQAAGSGLEAAAREARFAAFSGQLQSRDVLFLAHHLDDQVETFFLRLMRGAGVRGLSAMSPVRALGDSRVARPLLVHTRQDVEQYARQHRLPFVQDPSNDDTRLDRNFLRAQVLPLLATRWPGYRHTVARAAQQMAETGADMDQLVPVPPVLRSTMGDRGLAASELLCEPSQAAVKLRAWLRQQALPAPPRAQLTEFLRQLRQADSTAGPLLHCGQYTLRRYRDAVYMLPQWSDPPSTEPCRLVPGGDCAVPGIGLLSLVPATGAGLQLAAGDLLQLVVRSGGERARPVGRSGSNRLKTLLQEAAVPPWWRDRIPLLYLEGELLAVGDLWLCQCSRWRPVAGSTEKLWKLHWQRDSGPGFD